MRKRNFKYGQLFTHNGHVYQVLKTPEKFSCCEYCRLINGSSFTGPRVNCVNLTPTRAYLKLIK